LSVSAVSTRDTGALFERVPKATFRAHIADRLRHAILSGRACHPAAPLVETALAEQFDVSRAPLREALRQLVEEGLLVTVPYTGTRVADSRSSDLARDPARCASPCSSALPSSRPGRGATMRFRRELQAPPRGG
jgi:DNA-binding FadR family transcriptional regulator